MTCVEIGPHRLYLGDCLEVLPILALVDAVVTDIPYGKVNRISGGLRNLDKGVADVESFPLGMVAEQCTRLANTSYVFCGSEQVSQLRKDFVERGWTTRLCIWEKTNPSPMNGEHLWLSSLECCIFARKSGAYFSLHCASPVWRGPVERDQEHPTQKPRWLTDRLVSASVPPGGECLDFCMGSGTVGVSAVRFGRAFIGIEKEPKYFSIAVRRIREAYESEPLFAEVEPPAVTAELFEGAAA